MNHANTTRFYIKCFTLYDYSSHILSSSNYTKHYARFVYCRKKGSGPRPTRAAPRGAGADASGGTGERGAGTLAWWLHTSLLTLGRVRAPGSGAGEGWEGARPPRRNGCGTQNMRPSDMRACCRWQMHSAAHKRFLISCSLSRR